MPHLVNSVPKYRRHRASNQAVVNLNGHDFYLGPYGTKASRIEYEDRIALNAWARELAVDYSTIRRWILSGHRSVRLASVRIGRKRYTPRPAVARFFAAMNREPEITRAATWLSRKGPTHAKKKPASTSLAGSLEIGYWSGPNDPSNPHAPVEIGTRNRGMDDEKLVFGAEPDASADQATESILTSLIDYRCELEDEEPGVEVDFERAGVGIRPQRSWEADYLLEAALAYHELGLPITLCQPEKKKPIVKNWQNYEWTAQDIRQAFDKHGALNVGLVFATKRSLRWHQKVAIQRLRVPARTKRV